MTTATIVVIPDRHTCRGMTFANQQIVGSVPPGEYDVLTEEEIEYSDLGTRRVGKAVQLVNIATGDVWYVGVKVAEFLVREFLRPVGSPPLFS